VAGRHGDAVHGHRWSQDIEGLLAAHPEADVATVRQWVSEFATAISAFDMLEDFDKLVARSKSRT
jgi:hypothetical protein